MTHIGTSIELLIFPPGGAANASLCGLAAWTCGNRNQGARRRVLAKRSGWPDYELYSTGQTAPRSARGKLQCWYEPPIIPPRPAKPKRLPGRGRGLALWRNSRSMARRRLLTVMIVTPRISMLYRNGRSRSEAFFSRLNLSHRNTARIEMLHLTLSASASLLMQTSSRSLAAWQNPPRTKSRPHKTCAFLCLCMQSVNNSIYG